MYVATGDNQTGARLGHNAGITNENLLLSAEAPCLHSVSTQKVRIYKRPRFYVVLKIRTLHM